MLKRLAFAPASDKIAQWGEFRFVKSALELQIKFHARAAKRISEQMLRIQSRILDSSFFEIRSRRLQHFKDGHDVPLSFQAKPRNLSLSSDRAAINGKQ
jgi:hypothetical protein